MKDRIILAALLGSLLFFTACEPTSTEEAKYIIMVQPDFKEFIQYVKLNSGNQIFVEEAEPKVKLESEKCPLAHIFIYKTKDSQIALAVVSHFRPVKIVTKKILADTAAEN
jgi:hypothetical protein